MGYGGHFISGSPELRRLRIGSMIRPWFVVQARLCAAHQFLQRSGQMLEPLTWQALLLDCEFFTPDEAA